MSRQTQVVRWFVSKLGEPDLFFCGESVDTDPNPESLTSHIHPIWGLMRDASGFHYLEEAELTAQAYGGEVVQNPHY